MSGLGWIALALGMLLLGYVWGRCFGLREGIRLGQSQAPLDLRRESLERGYCLLCGKRAKGTGVYHSSLLML